jgi:Polymer-forming cytoskeletal
MRLRLLDACVLVLNHLRRNVERIEIACQSPTKAMPSMPLPYQLRCYDATRQAEGLVYIDERKLTVGATAKLTADIIAGELIVYGSVQGNVRGKGKIEITMEGSVNGDLKIIIENGAYFKGSIEIEKSGKERRNKSVLADGNRTGFAGGGRGVEKYPITEECLRSYAQA